MGSFFFCLDEDLFACKEGLFFNGISYLFSCVFPHTSFSRVTSSTKFSPVTPEATNRENGERENSEGPKFLAQEGCGHDWEPNQVIVRLQSEFIRLRIAVLTR